MDWQCCLAGSSKTALRILNFSMAMGVDYSFELIFNETCAPHFNGHNNSFSSQCVLTTHYFINFIRNETLKLNPI